VDVATYIRCLDDLYSEYWGWYILDEMEMRPLWIAWCPFVVFSPLHGLRYRGIDSSFLILTFLLLLIREWWVDGAVGGDVCLCISDGS